MKKTDTIFQVIKLLLGLVIAAALVKFAFFPNQRSSAELVAQGDFTIPTVVAMPGNIDNSLTLDATVMRNPATPVRATATGTVDVVDVKAGAVVNEGDRLLRIRHEEEKTTAATVETFEDGTEVEVPGEPYIEVSYVNVLAPVSGTVAVDVLVGQPVAIGESIGSITPATYHARVSVKPEQLYSLASLPPAGQLAVTNGPAPFDCTNLRTVTEKTGAGAGLSGKEAEARVLDSASGSVQTALICDFPAEQQVYDGSAAKLTIPGSNTTGVLTVPVSAVEGRFREGVVYLPAADGGKPTKRTVQLGVTDGRQIQITGGLEEGEEILQYVPAAQPTPDPMMGM